MEYALLTFNRNEGTLSREIILSLASYRMQGNPVSGYNVPLDGGLRGILSWIVSDEGHFNPANGPQYMVYSPITGKSDRLLLAGSGLEEWSREFLTGSSAGVAINSVDLSSTFPSDVEWGFVSLVLPHWVLLFDENLEYIYQDHLTDNIRAAYCPADENELEKLSPDLHETAVKEMIFRMVLNALPWRPDESM